MDIIENAVVNHKNVTGMYISLWIYCIVITFKGTLISKQLFNALIYILIWFFISIHFIQLTTVLVH